MKLNSLESLLLSLLTSGIYSDSILIYSFLKGVKVKAINTFLRFHQYLFLISGAKLASIHLFARFSPLVLPFPSPATLVWPLVPMGTLAVQLFFLTSRFELHHSSDFALSVSFGALLPICPIYGHIKRKHPLKCTFPLFTAPLTWLPSQEKKEVREAPRSLSGM